MAELLRHVGVRPARRCGRGADARPQRRAYAGGDSPSTTLPDNDLLLDFYNINGIWRVVVLERENRLRIEEIRNSTGLFLADVHGMTPGDAEAPSLVRAWAFYNEFAMWCLLAFCLSGGYLWLSAATRATWAWVSLGGGTLTFAALWMTFR